MAPLKFEKQQRKQKFLLYPLKNIENWQQMGLLYNQFHTLFQYNRYTYLFHLDKCFSFIPARYNMLHITLKRNARSIEFFLPSFFKKLLVNGQLNKPAMLFQIECSLIDAKTISTSYLRHFSELEMLLDNYVFVINNAPQNLSEIAEDMGYGYVHLTNTSDEQIQVVKKIIQGLPKSDADLYFTNPEIILQYYTLLNKVREIFNDNNIPFWLEGGALLGAVRNQGMIPWDTDIDIAMRQEDQYKLEELAKHLPNKIKKASFIFQIIEYIIKMDNKLMQITNKLMESGYGNGLQLISTLMYQKKIYTECLGNMNIFILTFILHLINQVCLNQQLNLDLILCLALIIHQAIFKEDMEKTACQLLIGCSVYSKEQFIQIMKRVISFFLNGQKQELTSEQLRCVKFINLFLDSNVQDWECWSSLVLDMTDKQNDKQKLLENIELRKDAIDKLEMFNIQIKSQNIILS
ncbi:UNKNOWN [Stylonychia lemnae]|uniref:LicD/FKTN/FKRP nucleotidyltransferase domain-containing protein n=1 Tax=Stylonychia lemnae TaxID=5949 RepID=A0A078AFB2_STYLE|nr:UNKNOWN [Stylonychia lemnae]|eukprot:CDW80217.1 UNKNOWN [Stylonychia lemnae]